MLQARQLATQPLHACPARRAKPERRTSRRASTGRCCTPPLDAAIEAGPEERGPAGAIRASPCVDADEPAAEGTEGASGREPPAEPQALALHTPSLRGDATGGEGADREDVGTARDEPPSPPRPAWCAEQMLSKTATSASAAANPSSSTLRRSGSSNAGCKGRVRGGHAVATRAVHAAAAPRRHAPAAVRYQHG